jgi:diguanylate cyclase (GGDEF)-like protein
VVLLPNTDLKGAIAVAEKIQAEIHILAIPHECSNVKPIVTVSLGIASIIPKLEVESATLLAHADRSLYEAKQQGRDRYLWS